MDGGSSLSPWVRSKAQNSPKMSQIRNKKDICIYVFWQVRLKANFQISQCDYKMWFRFVFAGRLIFAIFNLVTYTSIL